MTDKNILTLAVVKDDLAQAYCIETLKHYLDKAERGELVGVAVAAVGNDNLCYYKSAGKAMFRLLGTVEVLKTSIVDLLMEQDEYTPQ